MNLLGDLWGSTGDGVKATSSTGKGHADDGKRTFAQVVSSDSSDNDKRSAQKVIIGESKKRMSKESGSGSRLAGTKCQRSPNEASCGHCFRSTHRTADCRHQIVCLRCACVGHMAARCPVVRSPNRKRPHVWSKKLVSQEVGVDQGEGSRMVQAPVQSPTAQEMGRNCRASLSIPLTPETEKLRDELSKVAVLSLVGDTKMMQV